MGRLFGTDGIRGVAGEDLTTQLARAVGRAAAETLRPAPGERFSFLVGRDTRGSGPTLEAALAEGISSAGGEALLAGVQTTPAVAYLTVDVGAVAGAMISASHNPPEYNGIKVFGSEGYKLSDELEDRIEALVRNDPGGSGEDPAASSGEIRPFPNATERYLRHLLPAARARLDGMKLVVDCANGSASGVAPDALRRLGAEVRSINETPDGANINVGCGATHPEVLAKAVVDAGADGGVSHDGDADRALFADDGGNVVDGDQVLAACALACKEAGLLVGNTVVTTVMANVGFRRAMADSGIEVVETRVGDRYVLEEMLRSGASLGGEQSGHLIFRDHATTGDGILTAISFLSLAAERGTSITDLASCMRRFPQVLENVSVARREGLEDAGEVWDAVADAERALGGGGRVLVRASGTEPVVRVMVEAETEDLAASHARAIAERVRKALG